MVKDVDQLVLDFANLEKVVFVDAEKLLVKNSNIARNNAIKACPVDTGHLRASINIDKPEQYLYLVGTNLSIHSVNEKGESTKGYAEYVEFGTSKMAPRPFLRPALEKANRKFLADLKKMIDRNIKAMLS